MTLRVCVSAFVVAAFVGDTIAQKPGKPKPAAGGATVAGELGRDCDTIVRGFDREGGGFSGSVLVAKDGKLVLEHGYGMHDAASQRTIDVRAQWDWASVSKQFTAAAVLRLADKKKLSLDDPLAKHWPKVPADKKQVTVRHLLNHTSGIQSGFRGEPNFERSQRTSFEEAVLAFPMESEPGAKFEYSNTSYVLAAALVERVSGKTFEQFCNDELFVPAGMKDTGLIGTKVVDLDRVPKIARGAGFTDRPATFRFAYGNELTWGYRGCGGVVATTRDMLAWDQALRGTKLLSAAAKKELYTVGKDGYALGWDMKPLPQGPCASHSGSVLGVVTMYYRLLERNVVVALACNYEPKQHPAELANQLIACVAK